MACITTALFAESLLQIGALLKIWTHCFSFRIDGKGSLIDKANSYFEVLEIQGFSPDTNRAYAYALLSFMRWFGADFKKFKALNQKDLQDYMFYLNQKNKKPSSVNQRLSCVRAFYRFCFNQVIPMAPGVLRQRTNYKHTTKRASFLGLGARRTEPFLELKVKIPKKIADPLLPDEVDKFLTDIKRYRDLGITLTMLLCGLRSQEVIELRMDDVNFHQSCIKVSGKGRRERLVPMPFQLMQVLQKYLEFERVEKNSNIFFVVLQGRRAGEKMAREGIKSLFRYRRKKVGLKKAKAHQFRHAFASDMARAGVPLTSIQKMLGHADPRTSLIYIELRIEDIKEHYDKAMERLKERYATLSSKAVT